MTLKIEVICTGQLSNNVCILFDDETKKAIVFDPSFSPKPVLDFIEQHGLTVESILLTHGHFDHFAGVEALFSHLAAKPKFGLHRNDQELLLDGGGSRDFHMPIFPPGEPDFNLEHGQVIQFENHAIEVRSTPGHTPGSVIFVIPELNCAICGDLIFHHSVGRTDLRGGDFVALQQSIKAQVFTLPPETRLIPGHGEETTVQEEMQSNPFLDLPGD